eukprot:4676250-Amphidinium_carterae.1
MQTNYMQFPVGRKPRSKQGFKEKRTTIKVAYVCVLPRDVHILLGVAALQHLAQKRETQKQIRRLDKLGYLRLWQEILPANAVGWRSPENEI